MNPHCFDLEHSNPEAKNESNGKDIWFKKTKVYVYDYDGRVEAVVVRRFIRNLIFDIADKVGEESTGAIHNKDAEFEIEKEKLFVENAKKIQMGLPRYFKSHYTGSSRRPRGTKKLNCSEGENSKNQKVSGIKIIEEESWKDDRDANDVRIGDVVEAFFEQSQLWFPAKIERVLQIQGLETKFDVLFFYFDVNVEGIPFSWLRGVSSETKKWLDECVLIQSATSAEEESPFPVWIPVTPKSSDSLLSTQVQSKRGVARGQRRGRGFARRTLAHRSILRTETYSISQEQNATFLHSEQQSADFQNISLQSCSDSDQLRQSKNNEPSDMDLVRWAHDSALKDCLHLASSSDCSSSSDETVSYNSYDDESQEEKDTRSEPYSDLDAKQSEDCNKSEGMSVIDREFISAQGYVKELRKQCNYKNPRRRKRKGQKEKRKQDRKEYYARAKLDVSPFPKIVSDGYWAQRYTYFSKFSMGIQLDKEGWYSVTPESIAKHHAKRCKSHVAVDLFCGCGGNAIQLAFTCDLVIAIDIDPNKVHFAQQNAKIYGVEKNIEFIVGDALKILPSLKASVVFISPPWGGPTYQDQETFFLKSMMIPPFCGMELFNQVSQMVTNVVYFLPKNTCIDDLNTLAKQKKGKVLEVEEVYLNNKLKAITVYSGDLFSS